MTRDPDRRSKLVARLTDHILAHGMAAASLRPLAAAVGTSDRMLLYYFPDKAALVTAVLEAVAARLTALLEANRPAARLSRAALQAHLTPMLFDDNVWPFMQLWLEIASMAARGDAVCARVGGGIARGFVAWLGDQLTEPREALPLLITIEGAVLLKSLGLDDDVRAAMTLSE